MLLLVSCWEGLIRRPLTACVLLATGSFQESRFERIISGGSFRQSFQESKFQQHRFKSVSSSVIQERFLSVSTVIRGRQVQYVAAVIRGRQVRYVAAVIRVRSVCQDVAVQFVCVKFVKALPYSSSFKYVKPLQFSSCFVKALHSSQDIAARLWSIAYTVPVRLAGSNIRDHLRLRIFAKWFSLPTTD